MVVKTDRGSCRGGAGRRRRGRGDETAIGGGPVDEVTKLAAEPNRAMRRTPQPARGRKEADVTLDDVDDFVEFFIAAGERASPSTATRASAK